VGRRSSHPLPKGMFVVSRRAAVVCAAHHAARGQAQHRPPLPARLPIFLLPSSHPRQNLLSGMRSPACQLRAGGRLPAPAHPPTTNVRSPRPYVCYKWSTLVRSFAAVSPGMVLLQWCSPGHARARHIPTPPDIVVAGAQRVYAGLPRVGSRRYARSVPLVEREGLQVGMEKMAWRYRP